MQDRRFSCNWILIREILSRLILAILLTGEKQEMADLSTLRFSKYHGLGNDFILVENMDEMLSLTDKQIKGLCLRRTGVGADGFIEIRKSSSALTRFGFVYYNADGHVGSLCGNGARCALLFSCNKGIIDRHKWVSFEAHGGIYRGLVSPEGVSINFQNINKSTIVKKNKDTFSLNTGSPHLVQFVVDNLAVDVCEEGRTIRNSEEYGREGINVNFVTIKSGYLSVRTYERGVEAETFACGTGAVAAAIAYHHMIGSGSGSDERHQYSINFRCGALEVTFVDKTDCYVDIILTGPAVHVYDGKCSLLEFDNN